MGGKNVYSITKTKEDASGTWTDACASRWAQTRTRRGVKLRAENAEKDAEAQVQHHQQHQLPGGGAPPLALTSEPRTASEDDAHRGTDEEEDLPATNDEKRQ